MLHFPDLEPQPKHLKDPRIFAKLKKKVQTRIQDLTKGDFQVKIIDYGLALHVEPGHLGLTPCGTVNLIAPEQFESGYDSRVDVWGLGLITYMLLTGRLMFQSAEELKKGTWPLTNLDCSVELVRFISETVVYDREKRPFPDKVKDHPYFSVDVDKAPKIRSRLHFLSPLKLESFGSHIEPTYL